MGLDASRVDVLHELIPTIEVQSADASTAFTRSEHLYSVAWVQAAVAGQYSILVFRNPATSTKLGCFTYFGLFGNAAGVYAYARMERGGTAAGTAVAVSARDPRIWSDIPPYPIPNSIEVSRGSVVAVPGHGIHFFRTSALAIQDVWLGPVVVVPGTTLYVCTVNQNVELNGSVDWWERPIQAEEYA